MKKYLLIWFIIWVVISILVSIFGYTDALGGIALAAIISLIFLLKTLFDNWSGTVTQIKKEDVYIPDDDGGGRTNTIEYAYIKLTSGKTKKIQNMGYKAGDRLAKIRGETTIRIQN